MTKKDFEFIAVGFCNALTQHQHHFDSNQAEYFGWLSAVESMCGRLAMHNPRFDAEKFLRACGVEQIIVEVLGDDKD